MSSPKWVKLHLAQQTDATGMPEAVTGLLTNETPSQYVLNPMLGSEQDEEFNTRQTSLGMCFINKSYVWCCQVLEKEPELNELIEDEEVPSGSLG